MYLKNLSLRGFKTFADKTVIEFNPPGSITAIVGPNGCGKSNLVDAIRWVLGEQNPKELRSSALEEVIFAGSSARKSLSLAEVSIDLDNSDNKIKTEFAELAIKRRTFRGGESEFFINKANCRLKDIRDLFLDTGLGGGSYSIISQGQVDAVLSSKPEERREIFEEAAKINKYKFRKTAAERKLISTEQNMLRIADLKSEISNQLQVLEDQAKKAAQFTELKGKLKTLEIGLSKRQIKSLNEKKAVIQEKINTLRSQMELGLNLTKQYEDERTKLRDGLRSLNGDIEGMRLAISQSKLTCEENKSLILLEKEKQKNLEERIAEAKAQHESFSSKISSLLEKEKELDAQLGSSGKIRSDASTKLKDTEEKVIRLRSMQDGLERELVDLRSKVIELESTMSDQRNSVIELGSTLRVSVEEKRHDEALILKLENEKKVLESRMQELNSKASTIDAALKSRESSAIFPETTETLKVKFGKTHGLLSNAQADCEIGIEVLYGREIKMKSVSLNNEMILSDGIMSGGSLKDKLKESIMKEREIETLIEQARVKQESQAGENEIKNLASELDLTKRSLNARQKEMSDIAARKDSLAQSIEHLEREVKAYNEQVVEKSGKLAGLIAEKDSLFSVLGENKGEFASAATAYDNIKRELETIKADINYVKDYLAGNSRLDMERRLLETISRIKSLGESLPKFAAEELELEKKITAYLKDRTGLESKLDEVEKKLSGGTSDDRMLRDALTKEEVAIARLDGELTAIAEKMMNEYGMTMEMVTTSEIEIAGAARSREEAEVLRRAIADLGPVNLLATEEFEKAKERFTFIETQFQDLVQARENLSSLIKELDEKARIDFLETMKIINQNFSEIFATLFEGGEAKLVLPPDADVLEGGIDIIAKPGGKKWLNLSVMSGGERTLTALALLFALLRTHPSPFCLLDEADAALDEANVHRYTRLLKDFSKTTQVVIITHNKQTMEIADTMYGITMEEPGVSRVVSVKLAKAA